MGDLANNLEKIKKFRGLVPDNALNQFLLYLEDRVSSSLRKPRAIIYFWDELAVPDISLPNIHGAWIDMSPYGFTASVNYGDIIEKETSTARIECVDATRDEFHPFWGAKRHLFTRGNRFKIVMSERDLPGDFSQVEIPIFEGCVLSTSFVVGRSDNSANLSIEGQVLNFQRIFKVKTTTRAYFPLQDVTESSPVLLEPVGKGDMSFICTKSDGRKLDQQGMEIRFQNSETGPTFSDTYYVSTVNLTSPLDRAVVNISATKINKTGKEYKYSGFVRGYPSGTFVVKTFTKNKIETDLGWIARDILKNTGYQRLNNLSDEQLEEDIPNANYFIQKKIQIIDSEIGQMLDDIFLPIGRIVYIDPTSGRIKVRELAKKIKDSLPDFTYDLRKTIKFNYRTDLSNQTNVMQVVGQSSHESMLDQEEKEIAALEGTIGFWQTGRQVNSTNYPEHPIQYKGNGWEYVEFTVYTSESRKVKCRNWRIDPIVSRLPNSKLPEYVKFSFDCHYELVAKDEYECFVRLYYNNGFRGVVLGFFAVLTLLEIISAVVMVFDIVIAIIEAIPAIGGTVAAPLKSVLASMRSVVSDNNLKGIGYSLNGLLMQGAYRISVKAIPYQTYHQEISSKTSMPSEILSREGVKMETYNNPIISNFGMGIDCAKFLLALKRIAMQTVDTSSIYDYFIESGDIIRAEVSPNRYENFLVKNINFEVKRGGDLVASEKLGWIDPGLDINSFQNTIVPVIKIKNATENITEASEGLGSSLIPIFKNYFSIDENGQPDFTNPGLLKKRARFPAFQELEVSIENHQDILSAYSLTGEDFMYVYSYQSAKIYADSGKEFESLSANTSGTILANNALDAPAILRQSVPSAALFDAARLNPSMWTNGVGFSFVGMSEDQGGVSGNYFDSDNAVQDTNVAGEPSVADFRRDDVGNRLASQGSGIMFAAPTSETEIEYIKTQTGNDKYRRKFYVSIPIPPGDIVDTDQLKKARFFIRVGLLKIEKVISPDGSNVQIVPKFDTLVLSNAVQMSVYYTLL